MAKKITIGLSAKEFREAARQIEQYKKELNQKIQKFCEVLLQYGQVTAVQYGDQSPLGSTLKFTTEISSAAAGCKAMLIGIGQTKEPAGENDSSVNTLLLVEFGSGIHYNNGSGNPKQGDFGMGVGTFPGQTHAFDPNGWYYKGDDDQWHHSYGVKATMPMYNAAMEMRQHIAEVAKEVFGK